MINYENVKDRNGDALREPPERPTLEQSIYAWAVMIELVKLGYCHNYQRAGDYIYDVSKIIDKAIWVIGMKQEEKSDGKKEITEGGKK